MTSGSDLIEVIREGIPGTSMPAWKNVLTEKEIHDLVSFLAIDTHLPAESGPRAAMQPAQSDHALPQWIKRPVNH
jgi:mono/diheme cytochrome c family protein